MAVDTASLDRVRPGRSWHRWGTMRETKIVAVVMLALAGIAVFGIMQPQWIFTANTPTGGDMGAHVFLPAYVRDVLLPEGRILGWSNDWYAGFPVLYFYFPLPTLTIVGLDVFLPYGVAFKLVTIAGLVGLPFAAYFLIRCLGFSRPVATVAGVAGGSYVFMESHTIFGGNIAATLAGEFAFSWSLALGLVYVGLVARATREDRGFTPAAGVVLALAALSHIITTMVIVAITLPLLRRSSGWKPVFGAWGLGFAIAGFWAVPLLARVFDFTADMNWNPVEGWDKVLPREFLPIALLGVAGLAWAAMRRYQIGPLFYMAWVPVVGYFILDANEITKLYNARLLPFWYLSMFILAGVAVGLAVVEVARRVQPTRNALLVGTTLAAFFFLAVGAIGLSFAPGWARWNYKGYEGKESWPEYQALVSQIDTLPPGRVMWEANSDLNRYGTPMALMLLPYWTEGENPSMEGLYFESALTTPYHFLNAAEVSQRPSNPVRGLDYHTFEFERSLEHLPLFNVDYYVAFTDEAKTKADEMLTRVLTSDPFAVYTLPESELVDVATVMPGVLASGDFEEAARTWYDDVDRLDQWLVADGPEDWPVVTDPAAPYPALGRPVVGGGTVSDIVLENHRIAFRTTAVGVPHLVKVSHFPNWRASGAEGPYRAAPSLMVVVPTQEDVELTFGYTWAEILGFVLTGGALVGLGAYWWVGRRRRRARVPLGRA